MSNSNESPQSLESRMQNLEQKILKIEDQYSRILNHLIKPASPQPVSTKPEPVAAAASPITNHTQSKSTDGATLLLPLVAVICFILAGVFLVKLAIESGWLTLERQWGLLTLMGVVLCGVGRFFSKIEQSYRSYLSAAGVIVLFIAAYSSSLYFGIFPWEVAVGLGIGVSLICLTLFHYHRSELFAVICTIGTYFSPVLLGTKVDLFFNSQFFIIWSFLFAFLASFLQTRILSLTAAYLALGVYTFLYSDVTDVDQLKWIVCVLITQFFTFAYGVYYYSTRVKTALAQKEAIAYLPILLFFYGTVYYFLAKIHSQLAPWLCLVFACVVYLLYFRVKSKLHLLNSQALVHGFLGVVLFHSGYMQILPDTSKPWLLPLLLLLTFISEKKESFPKVAPFLKFIFTGIAIIEFGKICFKLITNSTIETILPAVATIGLGLFYYFQGSRYVKNKSELFLGLIHLLSVLSLYSLLYPHGSFAVSAGWGIYAGVILAIGFIKKDAALAKSSLFVLIVTSLKALVYDASQSPSGIRILSLLLTGVVVYVAGIFFKKVKQWPPQR